MRMNRTRQILQEGQAALGSAQSQLRSAEIPRMLAAAGLDWIFIDAEHGCFTIETVQDLVRSALMTPLTPIVRVAGLQYSLVARALDMGAEGVIFPRVESPDLAAEAVSWTKFPPQGVRGYGLTPPQTGYGSHSFAEITRHANEQTLVILQIESRTALEHCDELASVPGVDALMVGPADLSISLGVGGEFDHPELESAIERVIATCRRHGRYPAIQVRSPALARKWIGRGMQLVGCSMDLVLLWQAVREMAQALKEARGGEAESGPGAKV